MVIDGPTITLSSAHAAEEGPAQLRVLRVVHAPWSGRWPQVVLLRQRIEIGRLGGPAGPLALDDREVSRLHAVVEPNPDDPDGHRIVDQGSRNGTFVDGRRIEAATLRPGTVVRVGKTLMVYLEVDRPDLLPRAPDTPRLLGRSEPMRRLRAELAMVAPRSLPVLLLGETGAGKELVAEEIHRQSGRTGPFVAVNCAALPEALAESELFGHVQGAFTGAQRKHDGVFGAARDGTLFLDEVGECPPTVQAKLLRALATGEVRPVGASDAQQVDVRIVAATHRNLEDELGRDGFRADLFSRLQGWVQRVPPLRDRKDDILMLAQVFLGRVAPGLALSTNASEALLVHGWPFNVRELEQTISAAGVRAAAAGGRVRCEHLPAPLTAALGERAGDREAPGVEPAPALQVPRDEVPDREALLEVASHFGGNVAQIADYFGKDRKQIYRWAERLEVELALFRK
ncbi:MAG: sigma 54-interacting transcriptional regulator [Kofleriaceae bacterium]|nr:sigma 54-interacting transcriptional regulator [Kofleriaceae bacterium]MCB9573345.1 sigma 54-interacting transcriptional regulator [Kofleriaceae bacterium]